MTEVQIYMDKWSPGDPASPADPGLVHVYTVRPDLWSLGERWYLDRTYADSTWLYVATWTFEGVGQAKRRLSRALSNHADRPGVGEAMILEGLTQQETVVRDVWRPCPW